MYYDFADQIKAMCLRQREYVKHYASIGPQNLDYKHYKAYWSALSKDLVYAEILTEYYHMLCKIGKLKDQRKYVRAMIFELYPSYAKAYFKAEK